MGAGGRERGSREKYTLRRAMWGLVRSPRQLAKIAVVFGVVAWAGDFVLPGTMNLNVAALAATPLMAVHVLRDQARFYAEREAAAPPEDQGPE